MPKHVRNFWLAGRVDGVGTPIATGPRSSEDGFTLEVKMRDNGEVSTGVRLWGYVNKDGKLVLEVSTPDNAQVIVVEKTR